MLVYTIIVGVVAILVYVYRAWIWEQIKVGWAKLKGLIFKS